MDKTPNPNLKVCIRGGDESESLKLDLEKNFLELNVGISENNFDFLYLVNDNLSVSDYFKVGVALDKKRPIFSAPFFNHPDINIHVKPASVEEAIQKTVEEKMKLNAYRYGNLSDIQARYQETCTEQGFADETPAEITLLLCEELGELAGEVKEVDTKDETLVAFLEMMKLLGNFSKKIRNHLGIAVEHSQVHLDKIEPTLETITGILEEFRIPEPQTKSKKDSIEAEFADCFLLLTHLATELKIDIGLEVQQKELINQKRSWTQIKSL